jgi:putative transposase
MKKFNRQSIRLRGFDYTSSGAYFVTVCCHQRETLFGDILEHEMFLNCFGEIVLEEWEISAQRRKELTLGEFVVMPNHVHGIVWLHQNVVSVGAVPINVVQTAPNPPTINVVPKSLGAFVRAFKSAVTKRIDESRGTPKFPIWQRNYHEHIVRNDSSLYRIQDHIQNNPRTWQEDCFFAGAT